MPMTPPAPPLRVAIIGAGPSGFYAAEALQKHFPDVAIDLFDRLPTPFGLVRGGVAPDHPKIKSVTRIYDRIASHPNFRFVGNVHVGEDVTVDELREHYSAVIISTGAQTDRALGIPGEHLVGSHAATDLVGWYNGHPDYADRTFDLTEHAAAVVGIGNVAIDVTRILVKSTDVLATTDLVSGALDALRSSQLDTVHVLSRRGPVQAACTTTELREMGELEGVDALVDPAELVLDPISAAHLETADDRTAMKNMEVFRTWAGRGPTGAPRRVIFRFCVSPVEIVGESRVEWLKVVRNALVPDDHGSVRAVATETFENIPVGLVFRSVGYRGVAMEGVPFDARSGTIPNVDGRVVSPDGSPIDGLFVCGWIKRGPSGVIGTNKSCAAGTVDKLMEDLSAGRLRPVLGETTEIDEMLDTRGLNVVDWRDWQALDRAEVDRGAPAGRPREKFTRVAEMLAVVQQARTAE